MLEPHAAAEIARAFGLGDPQQFEGPVARGEQGQIWRLESSRGSWAVREPFEPQTEDEVREDTEFQEAARLAGVPTPRAVRTAAGDVIAAVGDTQVRVHEWVEMNEPDVGLDPAAVGALLAKLHCVAFEGEPRRGSVVHRAGRSGSLGRAGGRPDRWWSSVCSGVGGNARRAGGAGGMDRAGGRASHLPSRPVGRQSADSRPTAGCV